MSSVVHVIAPTAIGGAESVVLGVCEGLAVAGHAVRIAAIVNGEGAHPFVLQATDRGIPVSEIRCGHRRYRAQARQIAELLRACNASLVHTHGVHGDVIGGWAARLVGVPVVATLHGFTTTGWRDAIYDLALRHAHRRCAAVIAVSTDVARRLAARGVRPDRVHHVPNAWRPAANALSREAARLALGIPATDVRIGWVGRLTHEKGGDTMLEAMALLGNGRARLSILGDGVQRGLLEAMATSLGVDARVTWHGPVRDASRHMSAFDALVLSSRTEGSPMVLLEAMAAGVPIVAMAVGGVGDMLSGHEALLVPADRADLLAHAIRGSLADPGEARRRADAARARLLREFSVDEWVSRHAQVYACAREVHAQR